MIVKRTAIGFVGIAAAGLAISCTAAHGAVLYQFQPDPCVISLAPNYQADSDGILDVVVPDSAVTCPAPFTFNSSLGDLRAKFTGDEPSGSAGLEVATSSKYSPADNAVVQSNALHLTANARYGSTFSAVDTTQEGGTGMWVQDPVSLLYYRLTLASPFTVTPGVAPTPSCTLTMPENLSYTWGQNDYFVIPDSAVKCTGFTFNSRDYWLNATFQSRQEDQGVLYTRNRRVFNSATGTYTTRWELEFTSKIGLMQNLSAREFGENALAPTGQGQWVFGRFSASPTGYTVSKNYSPTTSPYNLTLAAPFTVKRATAVTAKVTRTAPRQLSVAISADRNAAFQNTLAPTYRRQPVLPATPADHAVISRNGKVIARVMLSPYGHATAKIADTKGKDRYTVTLVATDDNYAGSYAFAR